MRGDPDSDSGCNSQVGSNGESLFDPQDDCEGDVGSHLKAGLDGDSHLGLRSDSDGLSYRRAPDSLRRHHYYRDPEAGADQLLFSTPTV
jgi:hypothetical protein